MLAAARQPDVFHIVYGPTEEAAEKVRFEGGKQPSAAKAVLITM
jgi:hypothetical protein